MTKAVFFDVDGTLLDTTEYIYQAFEYSLALYNNTRLPRSQMSHTMGKSLKVCYQVFTEMNDVLHLMKSHHQFQISNPHLAKPYPHTLQTLKTLHEKGYKIGAITTRASNTVGTTLEAAGILPYIDHYVTADDVQAVKPDPEGINKMLNHFSVLPKQTIMVGDTEVDVQAGKNAGTKTVGALYGFHGERIRESKPDHVIADISEIINLVSVVGGNR